MITQFSSNIHRTNPWDWYMRYSMFSTAVLCHLCSGSSTAGENQASTSLKLHISVNHFRGLFRQLKTGAWKKKKTTTNLLTKSRRKLCQGRGEIIPGQRCGSRPCTLQADCSGTTLQKKKCVIPWIFNFYPFFYWRSLIFSSRVVNHLS